MLKTFAQHEGGEDKGMFFEVGVGKDDSAITTLCSLTPLLVFVQFPRVFLPRLRFSSLLENQDFQILISSEYKGPLKKSSAYGIPYRRTELV